MKEVVQKLRFNLVKTDSGGGFSNENSALIAQEQEQLQIQKNLEFENQLLLERQQSVKQIEKDIVQLNNVMKELGALVHEQETAVGKFFFIFWFIEQILSSCTGRA